MKARSITTISVVLLALAAVVGVPGTRRVAAVNPQPLPPHEFGVVGLTAGQTARIFVSNAGDTSGAPCPQLVLDLHEALITRVMWVSQNGSPVTDPTTGNAVEATFTLPPCASAFLDLDADHFLSGTSALGGRLEVRAVVMSHPPSPAAADDIHRDPTLATLEVFDKATGRTTIHLIAIIGILVG